MIGMGVRQDGPRHGLPGVDVEVADRAVQSLVGQGEKVIHPVIMSDAPGEYKVGGKASSIVVRLSGVA
jgi:hypothetical protein